MVTMSELCDDLAAEHDSLDDLVADLDPAGWDRPTPAPGWSVRDQIGHLAFFDEQATRAIADPEGFRAALESIAQDVAGFIQLPLDRGRAMDPHEVLTWWRTARSELLDAARPLEPKTRIAWFGPPMSAASFISARVMETWAHGQDVADTLEVSREPTHRLRHVAHVGVRARPFSYVTRGLPVPPEPVRVELTGPAGETWTWEPDATDSVTGDALDFCLVVTQRRHVADTDLAINGPLAEEWMTIAQAFAGPPGQGRAPGQFRRERAS